MKNRQHLLLQCECVEVHDLHGILVAAGELFDRKLVFLFLDALELALQLFFSHVDFVEN